MGKGQEQKAERHRKNEEVAEEAKKKVIKAWGKVLPFGAQVVASAAAYTVGVTATQLVGFVCKVSCATPVLGPCMGILGVGLASALAGQASKHTQKLVTQGGSPLKPGFWEPLDMDDVVLDAVLGVFMFKAMGGRFSSLMPSDLAKPGALAFESIPARHDNSEAYARPSVKRELARIFRRDGCHHCGSRRGPVIGDHMPPNKLVAGRASNDKFVTLIGELPGVGKVREMIGLAGRNGKPLQRFYPQCQRCSIKQATAMRNGKRVLVLHLHAPRYRSEHLAGVFVGIRHNVPPVTFPPQQPSDPRRRSVSRMNLLALTAAAPADADGGAAEQGGNNAATATSGSGHHMQQLGAQLLVQELNPGRWELGGLQGYAPAAAAAGLGGANGGQHSRGHSQQQQQQYGGGGHGGHQGHHHHSQHHQGSGGSSGGHKQQQESSRQGGSGHGGPQVLPGSMGLSDALQQQDREAEGTSLLVPEHAKQRAEAAFERHFTQGLAR